MGLKKKDKKERKGEIEIYIKVMAAEVIGFDCNHQARWPKLGSQRGRLTPPSSIWSFIRHLTSKDICHCLPPDRIWHKVNDPKVD